MISDGREQRETGVNRTAGVGDLVRGRRYPYVVADAGAAPMGEALNPMDDAAWRRSALPDVGVAPDVSVRVLPGAIWPYGQVRTWLERWPAGAPLPAMLVCGPHPRTRTDAPGVIGDLCEQAPPGAGAGVGVSVPRRATRATAGGSVPRAGSG